MKMAMKLAAPRILFEDPHLLVIDKPAGLLSQGEKKGDPNVVDWLRGYLGRPYVGLVHRLDRNTSGLMAVAKRTKAARRLTESLQEGSLVREYQAWLAGSLGEERCWQHWLVKDRNKNQVRIVSSRSTGAQKARLTVRPVRTGVWKRKQVTLCLIRLETGRSHQIRAQAAAEGLPVLGDTKYGRYRSEAWNRSFGRPALHSAFLSFVHPVSRETVRFSSPLPEDMKAIESL